MFTAGAKISMTFQLGAHMLTGGKYPNEQNFFGKGKTRTSDFHLEDSLLNTILMGGSGETDN